MRARCLRTLSLVLTPACLLGCATIPPLATATSGHVDCPADEIKISNEQRDGASQSWTAECHGKTHQCTAVASGESNQLSCSELLGSAVTLKGGRGRVELPTEGAQLFLAAEIIDSTANTYLEFSSPLEGPSARPKWADCRNASIIVDEAPIALGELLYRAEPNAERLRVPVSEASLETIRTGSQTMGSLCGERWTLRTGAKASIDALLLRVKEELAGQQTAHAR